MNTQHGNRFSENQFYNDLVDLLAIGMPALALCIWLDRFIDYSLLF